MAFHCFNLVLAGAGNEVTTSAYRDFTVSGASDPGGRLIEFLLR